MGIFGGVLTILAISLLAGGIAYVGDRVGHQIGRQRLSLFGLRPRYTSTIIAVATGMVIALAVTLSALLVSQYVRAAFFELGALNDRVNELKEQAAALDKHTHQANVVVNVNTVLYERFLVLYPTQSRSQQLDLLASYFDAVVQNLNRTYVPLGLRPYPQRSSDPEVRKRLAEFLAKKETEGILTQGPILIIAVASENLFRNDPIHFDLRGWRDRLIFRPNETIASIVVRGGTAINANAAFTQLLVLTSQIAQTKGMPLDFTQPVPINLSPVQASAIADQIKNGSGRYAISAEAAEAIYPHVGGLPVVIQLRRLPPAAGSGSSGA